MQFSKLLSENIPDYTLVGESSSMKRRDVPETEENEESFLDFLSRTISELNEFPLDADIYEFIGQTLAQITPKDTIVLVNSLDQEKKRITLETVVGLGSEQWEVESILGQSLLGLSFQVPESVITSMLTGECIAIQGLKELTLGWMSDEICEKLEAQPFFGKVWSAGISWHGKLNGAVSFVLPRGTELEHKDLITFFIHQVAGYLQRRKAEEAARENAELYRTLAESAQDLILICDGNGKARYINQYGAALLGRSPREIIGTYPEHYFPPFTSGEMKRLLSISSDTKDNLSTDIHVPLGGEEACFNAQIIPLLNARGEIHEFLVTARDITARKQAEKAVRESEAKFSTAFQCNPVSLTLVSASDGIFVDVNPAFLKNTGYTREEVLGKTSEALGIFVDSNEYARLVSQIRAHGHVEGMEVRTRMKSGEIRDCLFSSCVITIHGNPHILSTVQNITERKKAELALKESQDRLYLAMNASEVGIFTWNLSTNERNVFTGGGLLFGYTEPELDEIFRHYEMLSHPDDSPNTGAISGSYNENGSSPVREFERRIKGKDGIWQWMLIRGSVVKRSPEGRPVSLMGTFRDITKRKRSEDALRKANRQLGLLTSITRHDILNKVTVILGYSSLARSESSDPQVSGYLEKIESATQMIKSQIEFTRVYQDVGTSEPLWQRLTELVPKGEDLPDIPLITDLQDVYIYADPMISKVPYNLLDNSLRHGEHVTAIRITCKESDEGLIITWEDNGVGVPPEEKERIFERGYGKHTGLGLFLIREILAITGMTIRETGVEGEGARFEIVVPKGCYRMPDRS